MALESRVAQLWSAARSAVDRQQWQAAMRDYESLLQQAPQLAEAWYEFGWLLRRLGAFDRALAAYQTAIDRGAKGAEEILLNRAVILTDGLQNHAEAQVELNKALLLKPDYVPARLNLGNLHEDLGERDLAMAQYRAILAGSGSGDLRLEALARLLRIAPRDDALLAQARTAANETRWSPEIRANLWFAIGHQLEQRAEFAPAFAAFEQGNRIAASAGPRYDRAAHEALVDRLIALPKVAAAPAESHRATPLFVCGMFRSGSTLIEQVLSAHTQVCSGGELAFLPNIVAGAGRPLHQLIADLSAADVERLSQSYRAMTERLCQVQGKAARYFIDKRPDNFLLLGLIEKLFPAARIVYTVRNPIDNGLSVYQQHLDQRVASYSSNLSDIGHFYAQQRRLMEHYATRFEHFTIFDYDRFVASPDIELRRLLQTLDLPWQADCLSFHTQRSSVKTASVWQVRQPVHRASSRRWQHYAAHLQPLIESLRASGVALDDGDSPLA